MSGKKNRLHYGWVVFAACFIMVFVTLGFCSSIKSLYLAPVTKDTGIPRSLFSLTDVCRYAVVTVINIFFGRIVSKYGPRKMVACGFILLAASQFVYSAADSVLTFCIGGVLLGCGLAFSTTAIVGYFVEKWFTNSKGTIMGLILAANGLGGSVASQVVSPVIEASVSGWRNAYRLSALIVLAVGLLVVLLVRNDPADMGLEPMGKNKEMREARGSNWIGREFSEIRKKPLFWLTIFCCFMFGLVIQSYSAASSAHFRDVGIDPVVIANVMSMHMIVLFLAKTGTGFFFDRLGLRPVLTFCCICATASLFILAFATEKTVTGAYAFGILSSIGLPIETVLMPLLARDMFGVKSYSHVMGITVGVVQAGAMIGSPLVNLFYDMEGSYKNVFLFSGLLLAGVTVLINVLITAAHKDRKILKQEMKKAQENR